MSNSNLTEVKILGKKLKKVYRVWSYSGEIYEDHDFVENVLLWEGMLENPPFENKQSIYIDSLECEAVIRKIVRSTSNKYVYYVDHVSEVIEDEDTKNSHEEALIKSKEIKAKKDKDEEEKLNKEKETTKVSKDELIISNSDDINAGDTGIHLQNAIEELKRLQQEADPTKAIYTEYLTYRIILEEAKIEILKCQKQFFDKLIYNK